MSKQKPSARALHAGKAQDTATLLHAVPIYQTTYAV